MWLRGGLGEYSFSTGDRQRKRAWRGAHTLGKVLLHYSSPTVPFFWYWWGQFAQRSGCYFLLPAFSRSYPQLKGAFLSSRGGEVYAPSVGAPSSVGAWAHSKHFARVWSQVSRLGRLGGPSVADNSLTHLYQLPSWPCLPPAWLLAVSSLAWGWGLGVPPWLPAPQLWQRRVAGDLERGRGPTGSWPSTTRDAGGSQFTPSRPARRPGFQRLCRALQEQRQRLQGPTRPAAAPSASKMLKVFPEGKPNPLQHANLSLLTPGILVSALPELRCAAEPNAAGAFPGTEGRDEGELSAGAPPARLLAFGGALPRQRRDFCLRLGARGGREPDGGGEGARALVAGAHLFALEGPLAPSAREREAGTLPWESHRPAGGLDPHTPSLAGFPS